MHGVPTWGWVAPKGRVNVGDLVIAGGMFYFGTGLRAIGGFRGTEPALIDPALVVDLANPEWSGTG